MKKLKEYFLITFGVFLVSLAAELFYAPNNIAAGGVIGIAIIVNHFFPFLEIGTISLMMNGVLFIVAFVVIGGKFGAKTIYASLAMSLILWIMGKIEFPPSIMTHDLFLASAFGTIISAIGMGITFNQRASTGGTDIIAKIMNKFIHIPIGKSLLCVDFIVTLSSAISFGIEVGMYSLLSVIFNGMIIDWYIEGFNVCKQVVIISSKHDNIRKFIINGLDRSCTIFKGRGGYNNADIDILYTVINRREFIRLKDYIRDIDNRAFITVGEVHEVLGEGFQDISLED
ncbi:MAG: YitT family protein [Clostridium lundense]|nr:YitT family protein [Clostridium lundense]